MRRVTFFVPGTPSTAGSKRGMAIYRGKRGAPREFTGKVAVVEDAWRSLPWRIDVQQAAREAMAHDGNGRPLDGPLLLHVLFVLRRPRGHFGKRGLKASAAAAPITRPDCTKLLRAIEDALNGVCWLDDAQIIEQIVAKRYGEQPGASVKVRVLTVGELAHEHRRGAA